MGSMSIWHWIVVALVVMLLFGKGRLSDMMGDLAKGIKSFKAGMADDDVKPAQTVQHPPLQVAPPQTHNPVAPPVAATPEPMATVPPPHDPTRP